MWNDHKVQLAISGFVLFFVVASIIAYIVPDMRQQFYGFVFMGLGAMYTAVWAFVKPDGQASSPAAPTSPAPDAGTLSQPDTGAK